MRRVLVAVLVAVGLTAGACGGGGSADPKFYGITHDAYQVLPDPLTDTSGKPFSLVDDTHKPLTLVFFGYTHCPDICPMVMSSLASALTRLSDSDKSKVQVVFVTTDPSRDTPAVLRRYLDRYNKAFIGLTGPIDEISKIALPLAVYVAQGQKLPSGGYDLNTHSTQVTAIGADHRARVLWDMDTSSAQFASDIHTLLQKAS
ncbi:SCO family protein [Nocardioides sp.]|jgi:protein SCO1/2|uniref:SCO family protein n=1 Tax=Nocardioides sp. TaxID=35761 RepID=UPI002BCC5E22|nr:SCO family protein [Nocardioides sp.]HVX54249.1 SCO family protein [Nocardioides sp.]